MNKIEIVPNTLSFKYKGDTYIISNKLDNFLIGFCNEKVVLADFKTLEVKAVISNGMQAPSSILYY